MQRQPSLLDDVALVQRMRMKRWRGVPWKEKLDQCEAPVTRLARHPDDRECAEEPKLLTFPRTRPGRGQLTHTHQRIRGPAQLRPQAYESACTEHYPRRPASMR